MAGCCESEEGRAAERRGAAIAIAWWLFRGDSISTVAQRFERRFGVIPRGEYESLLDLGTRAHAAARQLGVLESSQSVPLSEIPIASGLPDSYWEGARFGVDVEIQYTDPTSGEVVKRTMRAKATANTTLGELVGEADEWIGSMMREYPERFPGGGIFEGPIDISIGGISIIRRY